MDHQQNNPTLETQKNKPYFTHDFFRYNIVFSKNLENDRTHYLNVRPKQKMWMFGFDQILEIFSRNRISTQSSENHRNRTESKYVFGRALKIYTVQRSQGKICLTALWMIFQGIFQNISLHTLESRLLKMFSTTFQQK